MSKGQTAKSIVGPHEIGCLLLTIIKSNLESFWTGMDLQTPKIWVNLQQKSNIMKIGILLHGCGVYDGTEIQEAVLTMLAIKKLGHTYTCFAPNRNQHHVVNHLNGEEMDCQRNILIESARIARGEILDLADVSPNDFDAVAMPGGFGTAKNFTQWAFSGPDGAIQEDIRQFILELIAAQIPIAALCMSPTTIAKALEGTSHKARLSVGSTSAPSPYDISGISAGIQQTGQSTAEAILPEVVVDNALKIVSAPCYMMEADILQVSENIQRAIEALVKLTSS
jgi:enhancing lycopene biosynthesis protein 2